MSEFGDFGLPDLTGSERTNALELTFTPYIYSGLSWDNWAEVYGSDSNALLHHIYKFNAIAGATYDISSSSYVDPFLLRLYDNTGNVIAANDESNDVNVDVDWIADWVAPYDGTYYVAASWNQGTASSDQFYRLALYEDVDTVPTLAIGDYINGTPVSGGDASAIRALGASISLNSSGDANITGFVGFNTDTDDYYKFVAPGSGSTTINLSGLSADLDIKLFDSSGNTLGSSIHAETSTESITYSVEANQTYYVAVTSYLSSESTYDLTINTPAVSVIPPVISPANNTKAKVFLGMDDNFTVSNSGATIYGGLGNDTITVAPGISDVTMDQNIERINFAEVSSNYSFKQSGNRINIYDASGNTLLMDSPVQGDSDGTVIAFNDVITSALLTGGVMTLGGNTVSSLVATTLNLTGTGTNIAVSSSGSSNASLENKVFTISAGNYTYNITGFGAGDVLDFPIGNNASITNASYSDGVVDLTWANEGQAVTIHLTDISTLNDVKLNGISDFITIFGEGTII